MYKSNIQPATHEGIEVCSISLNRSDRVRLIGCPVIVVNQMRSSIHCSWGQIQSESDYHGAHEFKLLGNPWYGQSDEAVPSRKLLTAILQTMAQCGWNLIQSADVSKKEFDKDTLFFEKGKADPDAHLFAISLNMSDRLRIIDGPAFAACVEDAIRSQWHRGIQHKQDYFGAIEYKLSGNPWFADGSETVHSRMLLCQVLANIRAKGYKLYASVDISTGHEGRDLESWVFRRVSPTWS